MLIRETHSPTQITESCAQEKWREEWYAPPFSSQQWNNTNVSFLHSDVPMCLQRKLQIGCLTRRLFAWVPRRVHKLACKHMICLQATGLGTMICLQANWQGLQGMQTYDMSTNTWLAKISYVPELHKVIPFVFVGIGPINRVQIGIHMIPFGWSLGGFAKSHPHFIFISWWCFHHRNSCPRCKKMGLSSCLSLPSDACIFVVQIQDTLKEKWDFDLFLKWCFI